MCTKTCVFCGVDSRVVTMSKEHVLRDCLRKYLPPQIEVTNWRRKFKSPYDSETASMNKDIPINPFDFEVNDVCKRCNETWLDELVERPVERYLASLMIGYPLPFTPDFLSRVALWASKTAATRELMEPVPRSIPSEHYHYIKKNLQPPPFTHVFLANITSNNGVFTRHHRFFISSNQSAIASVSHFTTFIIGQMALYVIGVSEMSQLESYWATTHNLVSNGAYQIWPLPEVISSSVKPISLTLAANLSEHVRDPFTDYSNSIAPIMPILPNGKLTFQI